MEESTRKPGKRAKKGAPVGLIAGVAALAVAAAAVGGYFGLCSWVKGNGCLLPGAVAVDDRGETVADLGRLTREDALAVVSQEMGQRLESRSLTLLYGEGKRVELPGDLMACSPDAAVDVGFSAKEGQPLWKLGALWLGAAQEPVSLSLSAAAFTPEGEAQARRVIKSIADELYVPPVDFTYEIGEEAVEVTPGVDGQTLDTNALFEAVENALTHGETELRVETDAIPSAELSGQVLSSLIHVEPQPAGVDESGKLTPAVIGRSVNAEEAQTILDSAAPGESCSIPLEFTPPETGADESLYYKDLLSSVTTTVSGTSDRFHNVALSASFCQGKVLQPGEVFSYLSMVSPISTAHGFQVGTGYKNGQTVDMVGGGVCQMSSSLYYCAVYANLEIVSRSNHAFATGYIPNGLDATVYAPRLDFKFRNNTGFPIKIVTSMSGKQLTVQLYGTNIDGIKVETERYTRSTTEWTTVYKPDVSIPRGRTKVDVTPYTGYVVDVYRCVYDSSGKLISRTFENHSSYAKRDKVILYNPADDGPWGSGTAQTDPPEETTPDVTEPPVIEPPVVTEPPVSEPPVVTEPPVTEPPVTEPPVTEPPVTEPPATEPPATEPPVVTTPEPVPETTPEPAPPAPEGGAEV